MEIDECKALVNFIVYWPGINKDIEKLVRKCMACTQVAENPSVPLKPTSVPQRP